MKKIFIVVLILLIPVLSQTKGVYILDLHYENGDLTLNNINFNSSLYASQIIGISGEEFFNYELFSHNTSLIDKIIFEAPNEIVIDEFIEKDNETIFTGEIITLDTIDFLLITDYYPEASNIVIKDSSDNILIEVDVAKFSKCNQNLICEGEESTLICASDCQVQEGETQEESMLGLIVIITLLLFAFIALKRR